MFVCESACVRVLVPDDKPWNRVSLLCRGFFIRPQLYCFSVWVEASSHKECFHLVAWPKPFPPPIIDSLAWVHFHFFSCRVSTVTQFEVRCIWIKTAHGCIWLFYWIDQQADGLSALVENIIMYACTEAKLLLPVCSFIASRLVLQCSLDPDVVKHIDT